MTIYLLIKTSAIIQWHMLGYMIVFCSNTFHELHIRSSVVWIECAINFWYIFEPKTVYIELYKATCLVLSVVPNLSRASDLCYNHITNWRVMCNSYQLNKQKRVPKLIYCDTRIPGTKTFNTNLVCFFLAESILAEAAKHTMDIWSISLATWLGGILA